MSARLAAVVSQLGVQPHERVLEIGCGHGVAAAMVCDLLTTGTFTAVDRSAKMIEAATQRNRASVAAGKAEFLIAPLEDLDLGSRRFDLVFAVRVGLFHRAPDRARTLVQPWLAPGGRVLSFYDEPA